MVAKICTLCVPVCNSAQDDNENCQDTPLVNGMYGYWARGTDRQVQLHPDSRLYVLLVRFFSHDQAGPSFAHPM